MRLNSANRSFFTLAGIVLVPYALLGVFGCGLLSLVVYRLAHDGIAGLHRDGQDLRPAALFFAVVTTGTVVGVLSLRRQVRATRRLSRWVDDRATVITPAIAECARRAELDERVVVIDEDHPCSFTFGLVGAKVAISTGLADRIGADELDAVLEHERYHVRANDTVKVVIARAGAAAFFFLPVLGHLRDRYLSGRELAADRRAIQAVGERSLAGALYRATEGPSFAEFGAAAALGGSAFLDERVEQLEHGEEPAMMPLPRRALGVTAVGLTALTIAFALAIANGGANDAMSMNGSMRMSAGWGTVTGVLGGIACTAGWVAVAFLVVRRGRRHLPFG